MVAPPPPKEGFIPDDPLINVVERFKKLFVSRSDTFALQLPDGSYVRVERPLEDGDLLRHLRGEQVVGVYQLDRDSRVRWVCFDFDAHGGGKEEAKANALRLLSYLRGMRAYEKACLLEDSGGGYHVWLFFAEPVPASGAKYLAERLLDGAGVRAEVFPKQEALPEEGFGSLVKLPLGRNRKWNNWSVLLDPPDLSQVEPLRIEVGERRPAEAQERPNLSGCVALARISQGVDEGVRDESAFFLARYMYALGLPSYMAHAALLAWDRKNRPPLGERTIADKVKSAYRRGYRVGSLSLARHELLGRFCEGCRRRVCSEGRAKPKPKRKLFLVEV